MEPNLKQVETQSGAWDEEHVKALLHFPRFPMRLIQHDPWQTWIGQRGGLKAVYAYLQNYPLAPTHRRMLDVVLSNPEAVADVYADRLNISRATYFYQLRELVPALVQALNHWERELLPVPTGLPSTSLQKPPVFPTPLIGAEGTLQTITRLLMRDDVRLLTLLGPGGIGKTRLSTEVAHILNGSVCFVGLSEVRDPDQVPAVLAGKLGLKDANVSTLKAYLCANELLLIFDNFEQILPARAFVTDLLASAPRLKILVTSRAALQVYGEHEFVVPALAMPAPQSVPDQKSWAKSPAMTLFTHSAQAVNPAFCLAEENMGAVAELCLQLDGLPLAIELAAYQAKYFSPQAMLARLSHARLNFLSQAPKRMPPHQQSMRAMLEWSFDLLPADLQTLFCRVAVFSGGCTIEAAESVCSRLDAQAGLTGLVEHSLLEQQVGPNGEPRFHMLGITRDFALEKLEARGETDSLKRIHALHYLQVAEQARSDKPACEILNEHANLMAALQWVIDQREWEQGFRLVLALWDHWVLNDRVEEGSRLTRLLLDQTRDMRLPTRAKVRQLLEVSTLPFQQFVVSKEG
jgi:predicted ATPase